MDNTIPNTKIVPMFHYGRCGSTVINLLLPRNEISVVGELYTPNTWVGAGLDDTIWIRQRDRWKYTQRRIEALFAKTVCTYGSQPDAKACLFCEVKLNLFVDNRWNSNSYYDYLRQLGVETVVFLQRRNLLRRLVSVLIAQNSGIWHIFTSEMNKEAATVEPQVQQPGSRSVSINVDSVYDPDFFNRPQPLLDLLRGTQAFLDAERVRIQSRFRMQPLIYEDHVERDPNVATGMIMNLFGRAYTPQDEMPVVKQNTQPLSQTITNFADVRAVLSGTEFEWMLYG